jgi:hypothetical protein
MKVSALSAVVDSSASAAVVMMVFIILVLWFGLTGLS